MTNEEFNAAMMYLRTRCIAPSDAQIAAVTEDYWEEFSRLPIEVFMAAIKYAVRLEDHKFIPQIGPMLAIVKIVQPPLVASNMTSDEQWLVSDPSYRRQQKEESERAAREFFASKEYQDLLATFDLLRDSDRLREAKADKQKAAFAAWQRNQP